MIDTIKLKIPLTPLILLAIQKNSFKQQSVPDRGVKLFARLFIPPDNRNLIIIKDHDLPFGGKGKPRGEFDPYKKTDPTPNMYFYVEGSMPKLEYGENVRLVYPSQLPPLLKRIEKALIEHYGDVPSWKKWEVQRIDVVYAWKFPTHEEAVGVMRFLSTLVYKRKKGKLTYDDESVTFVGRSFSVKFYLKQLEFEKKPFNELYSKGYSDLADKSLQLSKGVIRYEIKLHKSKLISLAPNERKTINFLDLNWYYKILNDCLSELLRNTNRVSISDEDALNKLNLTYKKEKANRLFLFWKTYYLKENHIKRLLKNSNHSTTLLRNFKELTLAGVGVPQNNLPFTFDLSIPNANVIAPQPAAPFAPATEQAKPIIGEQEMIDLMFEDEVSVKTWRD